MSAAQTFLAAPTCEEVLVQFSCFDISGNQPWTHYMFALARCKFWTVSGNGFKAAKIQHESGSLHILNKADCVNWNEKAERNKWNRITNSCSRQNLKKEEQLLHLLCVSLPYLCPDFISWYTWPWLRSFVSYALHKRGLSLTHVIRKEMNGNGVCDGMSPNALLQIWIIRV
jgi:hypothetical protein